MLDRPHVETASDDSVPTQVAFASGAASPWAADLKDGFTGPATASLTTDNGAGSADIKSTASWDASRTILDSRNQNDSPLPPNIDQAILRPGDPRVGNSRDLPPIPWVENDLYAAYNKAMQEHKPLIVMFYADWCNYCKAMDKEALANPEFRKFAKDAVFLRLNVEKDDQYQNTKQLMNRLDIKEFPAMAIMRVDGPNPAVMGRIIGYHNGPQFVNVFRQVMPKDIVDRHPLDPGFQLLPTTPSRPLNPVQLAQTETAALV